MKPDGAKRLHVEPITLVDANKFITAFHRHHGAATPMGGLFCLAAADDDGRVCGVAVTSFPLAANRLTDGWRTIEVTRVATDGTPNACSVLYAGAARAAKQMGFQRIITYILDYETGTSIKAAGWKKDDGWYGNISWATHGSRPGTGSNFGPKGRWSLMLNRSRPMLVWPPEMSECSSQIPTLFEWTTT